MTFANSTIRLFLASIVMLYSCSSVAAAEQMTVLDQVSRLYGPVNVYLGKDCVKVESQTKDRAFLCKAPTWDVIMYNQKRKVIFKLPFSVWSKSGIQTPMWFETNDSFKGRPHTRERPVTYAGLSAKSVWYPDRRYRDSKIADYTFTNEIATDGRAKRFLQDLFDLPSVDATPLRFRRLGRDSFGFNLAYNQKDAIRMCLQTRSVKKMALNKSLFEAPTDFKPAVVNEVFFDPKKADDAYSDLMGE